MTDLQLLKSLRLRAEKRIGNFLFVRAINHLTEEAKYGRFEKPVIDSLLEYCNSYRVPLDESDIECMSATDRAPKVDPTRRERLIKANIISLANIL